MKQVLTSSVHPGTGHEVTEREWRWSFTPSLGAGWGYVVNAMPRQLYRQENTRYPLYWRVDRPQGRSGRLLKISRTQVFDPQTVQAVAGRYID